MSEKKRKRESEKSEIPVKKVAIDTPASLVKVLVLAEEDEWSPIIASTPGLSLPKTILLKPYERRKGRTPSVPLAREITSLRTSELLLQSSAHPQMDYIGKEEDGTRSESLLQHYVGVYDPTTGELQVMEARKMVVRGTLRKEVEDVKDQDETAGNNLSARNALSIEFGTKKSKKAFTSITENAITRSKPRATSPGGSQRSAMTDPVTAAVLDSMVVSTNGMASRDELQSAVDEAKPRPKANLKATTPSDVYPVETLIGIDEMKAITVRDWQDAATAKEAVNTKSRFVSKRLQKIASSDDVRKLKALRYMLLLLDFFYCLKPGAKGAKKIPQKEDLKKALGMPDSLVQGVKRRFADETLLNKWHLDKLMTHIAALALVVDNFEVDTYDLKEDLKLENKQIQQYFKEIGCQVNAPTEADRMKMKLSKTEAASHKIARLRIPLEFPKQRVIARKRR
ncbi:MAG: DNA-directed RNA polymerase I subunit rpa49 [Pycnora praestabilis]|nr:MAG: DNA-directed RNA polymerase I subunit rpa49 [Pycnora praestabilis]